MIESVSVIIPCIVNGKKEYLPSFKLKQVFKQFYTLLKKEFVLELRQKYAIGGILLYVAASTMLVFLSMGALEGNLWITFYWLLMLFAAVNAIAKSFTNDAGDKQIYYYQLVNPQTVLFAKIAYNFLLLLLMAGMGLVVFILLFNNPITDYVIFFTVFFLGVLSFSILFTVMSAIATQSGGSAVIMPIISFPVIVPVFVLLLKLSTAAVNNAGSLNFYKDVFSILAIIVAILAVSFLLFPYIWRD